jgi:processive 1,2-diacylglycerol beta-glucosyltransferase
VNEPQPDAPYIAVFSCNFGGGHNRVAEVLAHEMSSRVPNSHVEVFDYIEQFVGHASNVVSTLFYTASVRRAPWAWRWFYQATSAIPYDSRTQRALNRLGRARLETFLATRRPSLVVCTYCVPAGAMSDLKKESRTKVPCVTVVTDHAIHSQWVHPYVDRFIVSSEYVRDGLIQRGIPAAHVAATGIPIDPRFAEAPDRETLRRKHGVDPFRPAILVMVGAVNLLRDAMRVYEAVADLPRDIQLLFVCGRDETLRRTLEARTSSARNPVRVFGFVDHVHELMACSTLMVSKAGGVTTSEALAAELPVVVVNPIPGHEEENVRFLEQEGAGVRPRDIDDLVRTVVSLLDEPARLGAMRAAVRRLKRPDAAARAADVALLLAGLAVREPAAR